MAFLYNVVGQHHTLLAQGESQISPVVYQMLLVFFLFSFPAICCITLELPAIHAEKLSQRMALTVPREASAHSCSGGVLNTLLVLDPHFVQVWARHKKEEGLYSALWLQRMALPSVSH